MKYVWLILLILLLVAGGVFFGARPDGESRITIANLGTGVVELWGEGRNPLLLGENGTGYFDEDMPIQIGKAIVRVGRRVEVANLGDDPLRITYPEPDGSEQTVVIGKGETGYVHLSVPFQLGEATLCIRRVH